MDREVAKWHWGATPLGQAWCLPSLLLPATTDRVRSAMGMGSVAYFWTHHNVSQTLPPPGPWSTAFTSGYQCHRIS